MTSTFTMSARRRLRAPAVLLAAALGLAACGDDASQTSANDSGQVVHETIDPAPAPEPDPVEPAPVEEVVATNNVVAEAPPRLDEEPVPVDQQTIEDADATGMTSRYAGEDAVVEAPAGNETAPAE